MALCNDFHHNANFYLAPRRLADLAATQPLPHMSVKLFFPQIRGSKAGNSRFTLSDSVPLCKGKVPLCLAI